MANTDAPHGLSPVGHALGVDYNASMTHMYAPDDYNVNIFVGDPVIKMAAGSNDVVVNVIGGSFQIGTLPEVNIVAAGDGNAITGVCVGFEATNRDSNVYGAANTVRVLKVLTDPYIIYKIQADGAIPPLDVGLNANVITTHGGSTVTGISGYELDTTSDAPDADPSNQLLILRQWNSPDNATNLIHNEILVRINEATDAASPGGMTGI